MIRVISSSEKLSGIITVPGDKSISHRAAIIGALASGVSRIWGFSTAADCLSTLLCLRALGVEASLVDDELVVSGLGGEGFSQPAGDIYAGNSGTTMRMLAGALAPQRLEVTITGDESLLRRPMARIIEPLTLMGADIESIGEGDLPPIRVRGGDLEGIDYEMPVPSAQVKSAILLAGLGATGRTTVREKVRTRDHTERMLERAGVNVSLDDETVIVEPGTPVPFEMSVPGDLSSAAFIIAAALLCPGSEVTLSSVGLNPTRTGFIDLARLMGGDVEVIRKPGDAGEPRGDITVRYSELHAIEVSGEGVARAIDEVPLVALLATRAHGCSVITGAEELKVKESDRLMGTVVGLRSLGASIEEVPGGMKVEGPAELEGARVSAYRDHRIAMMLCVAGLSAGGHTEVDGWEWTEISYPGFAETIRELGGRVVG